MAACWKALAARPGIDLTIIAGAPGSINSNNAYSSSIAASLPCQLLTRQQMEDRKYVRRLVAGLGADVICLPGWFNSSYSALAFDPELSRAAFIMGLDTARRNTWRQRLARLAVGRLVGRMKLLIVPGERGWQFVTERLKFPEIRIRRGLYGLDTEALSQAMVLRQAKATWPKRFLYVGRYVKTKGLDVLMAAYRKYRLAVPAPWPLSCYGKGEMAASLAGEEGVTELGFVQPDQMAKVFADSGAFVLASRQDPWPLVIVEAMATGLPVLCSNACGSAVEMVRPYSTGLTFASESADSLCRALCWMHNHYSKLPEMGCLAQYFARPYSAQAWAERWSDYLKEAIEP